MALTSTLFTGLSGLDVNQTRLNVVGNNIANVNTVAFKASRALFKPQFYVTDASGSPPSADFGGSNPSQRGLGATVATIEKDFGTGSIEPTGKSTDIAIDGDGFFIVQGKEQFFTRDGSFTLNSRNELVTSAGDFVQGFGVDDNGEIIAGQLQNLTLPIGGLTKAEQTTTAFLSGNLNAAGEVATGGSIIESAELFEGAGVPLGGTGSLLTNVTDAAGVNYFAVGDVISFSGTRGGREQPATTLEVDAATTVDDLLRFMEQGLAIDPGETWDGGGGALATSGGSVRPGATGSHLVLTGNTGEQNTIAAAGSALTVNGNPIFSFTEGEDANGNVDGPVGESITTTTIAYDSLGNPLDVGITMVLRGKDATGTQWDFIATSADDTDFGSHVGTVAAGASQIIGTGSVRFDTDGRLIDSTGATLTIARQDTGAGTPVDINLDFSEVTALADNDSELFTQQDGTKIGTLTGFSVGGNGIITGTFDNGLTNVLGQVAVATFDNPLGLSDNGSNLYSVGSNSGEPRIGAPLEGLAGSLRSGALELSNVDLSNEFINLIIASTGFSAASRVITTSDQLMTELLNTSR